MHINTHEVRAKYDATIIRRITGAKDEQQAWNKFVTQYFRGSPLMPSRNDYEVVLVRDKELSNLVTE